MLAAPAPKRKLDKKQIKAEKRMKKRTARAEKRAAKAATEELEGPKPKVPPLAKGQIKMHKMKMRMEKLEREGHQKLAKAKKLAAQVQAIIDAQVSIVIVGNWFFRSDLGTTECQPVRAQVRRQG